MTDITFEHISKQIQSHFAAGTYAEGLALADSHSEQFSAKHPILDYWRACLVARVNNHPRVIEILETALANGMWYGEALLQDSPSLKPLKGNSDYEHLLEISRKMQANDPVNALPLLVVRPEDACDKPDNPCPPLIFLHGNTDTAANNLEHWLPAAAAGWLLALPQSSGAMWAGAYAWTNHETGAEEVENHYAKLTEQYALDSSRTILAGFSMGAEIALWLALTGRIKAQGFILLGPGGPFMDEPEKWAPLIRDASARGLRGAIITGLADTSIPHDNIRTLVTDLNTAGIPTHHEEHIDLAHAYPPNFDERLRHALEYIMKP